MGLEALLAPLDPGRFLAEHYRKKPLVIRGAGGARDGLSLGLGSIVQAITGEREPSGKLLMDAEHLREDGKPTRSFASRFAIDEGTEPFWDYLEQGHAIVWNGARGATPELDLMCRELADDLGASVCPNVYATGTAGAPLDFHFDCHEVLVLQVEGKKEWSISNVRIEHPLDIPAMHRVVERTLEARRAEALADLAIVTTVEPGDVVYIPRGQFHNARAVGGRSLHVTFGIQHLTGLDVLEAVLAEAMEHAAFREYLPVAAQDPTGDLRVNHLRHLARRAAEITVSPAVASLLESVERLRRSS